MNKDKELEEAINILNNKIYSLNENIKIYDKGYDLSTKNEFAKEKEAIETVLQELEDLQQKEKRRIIGNIYEVKIEDLEPVLKPYFIPKKKIEEVKNKYEEKYNNSVNNVTKI